MDIPYSPTAVAALDLYLNVLTINSGGKLYAVKLNGSYAGNAFGLESDFGALNFGRGPAGTRISVTAVGLGASGFAGPLQIVGQNNIINAGYGTVITNAGPNTIVLGSGPVTVQSNGADTILGGTGQDGVILAGNGALVVGGTGTMTVQGGAGNGTIFAGKGGLSYMGGSGSDVVVANGNAMTATGGTGAGQYWGGAGSILTAGTGGPSVLVGSTGSVLNAAGSYGSFLVATGTYETLNAAGSTGDNVMIAVGTGSGTGTMRFIAGSGNDLMGLGDGINQVTLGAGHDTVFARGTSTITAGTGSAVIALSGQVILTIAAGTGARSFELFNFLPGADRITLQGFDATAGTQALANQANTGGSTVLTMADSSKITLYGVQRADASVFG